VQAGWWAEECPRANLFELVSESYLQQNESSLTRGEQQLTSKRPVVLECDRQQEDHDYDLAETEIIIGLIANQEILLCSAQHDDREEG
jgi:hypothetical protein